MLLDLIKGVSLLLALCLLQSLNRRLWRPEQRRAEQIVSGLLFGSVCIFGMMLPITLVPGVIFDARSVVLSMAGLFGGPLAGSIAGVLAAAYRLWLGGAGVEIGVGVIAAAVGLGLLYRWGVYKGKFQLGWLQFLVFGFVVHSVIVLLFTQLPVPIAENVLSHVALPFVLTFTIATAFLGAMLHDLSSLADAEAALHRSEARLRAIVEAIPDLLLVLDREGRYLEVLSPDQSLLYADTTQLIGQRMHDILPPEEADRFLAVVKTTLNTQQPRTLEYTLETLGGRRYFEGRIQPMGIRADGSPAVVFLARDMTELKHNQDSLQNLIAMTTDQNQRLQQFTYIVSHNIRSHVANLLGLVAIMDLEHPVERKYVWDLIVQSTRHLDEVIIHLNDMISIQALFNLPQELLPLRTTVEQTCHELAPLLDQAGVSIQNEVSATQVITAVPAYLNSILHSLITNALRYRALTRPAQVRVYIEQALGYLVVCVADNGQGLDLERVGHRLFGMYQTFHGHPEAKGLGLFLTKIQIQAMKGKVEMFSQVDVGTTVKVYFPGTYSE